jgi:hypothetical protein
VSRPGASGVNDVTPEQVRDYYRAAARFYRQTPWRSLKPGETIRVKCEQVGGPRYALVLGRKGKLKGLMLCDDLESRLLLDHPDYESVADRLRGITLHFVGRDEISLSDLERAGRYGFEVNGPRAYPAVFRMEPSRQFRSPDSRELDLLEACLWVIPDFVERARDRTTEVYEYSYRGKTGPLTLDLSWVPMDDSKGKRRRLAR